MNLVTSFANFLRSIIPYSVKQKGKSLLRLPATRIHPDWRILEDVSALETPHVVLDLGARNGWFFKCWKEYSKGALVHAFEPDYEAYEILAQQYADQNDVSISPMGVGATKSLQTFYYMQNSSVSSSFLPHDSQAWADIKYDAGEIQERQLEITTLDDYCEQKNLEDIYLIKIDIQGYELEALLGATSTLDRTSYLLIESSIKPLYQDSANFTQVHDFMAARGFHLMNFRAWHRGNNQLIEADMLFRRNSLIPPIPDDGLDREYIGG